MSQTITQPRVKHASFTIEHTFKAPPKRVFAAWATADAKSKWFAGATGECEEEVREFNFFEGGSDRLRTRWKSGMVSDFRSTYWEIRPDQRIVYVYDMTMNDRIRMSVSLATIEFASSGAGTRMTLTEQGAFLEPFDPNGDDPGSREHGTRWLMDKLAAFLES